MGNTATGDYTWETILGTTLETKGRGVRGHRVRVGIIKRRLGTKEGVTYDERDQQTRPSRRNVQRSEAKEGKLKRDTTHVYAALSTSSLSSLRPRLSCASGECEWCTECP